MSYVCCLLKKGALYAAGDIMHLIYGGRTCAGASVMAKPSLV